MELGSQKVKISWAFLFLVMELSSHGFPSSLSWNWVLKRVKTRWALLFLIIELGFYGSHGSP
jgi:hypothetical protein